MIALWPRILVGLLIVGAIGGAGVWYGHQRYAEGEAAGSKAGDARAAAAAIKQGIAEQRYGQCQGALAVADKAAERALAHAAQQARDAQAAVAKAHAAEREVSRTLNAWMTRYSKAVESDECSVAREALCDALLDY